MGCCEALVRRITRMPPQLLFGCLCSAQGRCLASGGALQAVKPVLRDCRLKRTDGAAPRHYAFDFCVRNDLNYRDRSPCRALHCCPMGSTAAGVSDNCRAKSAGAKLSRLPILKAAAKLLELLSFPSRGAVPVGTASQSRTAWPPNWASATAARWSGRRNSSLAGSRCPCRSGRRRLRQSRPIRPR